MPVAKHGNRAASSKAGSADVLEALGVNLEASPARVAAALDELGVGFMFARNYHPALRHAAGVRSELAARTVFNVLGPLSNPAGATHLLVGVYTPALTRTLAEVLHLLGAQAALVVNGGGLDEFTVAGVNTVSELKGGVVSDLSVTPEEVGLERFSAEQFVGGTPADNAEITRNLLQGRGTPAQRAIVALNAGAALSLAGQAADLAGGVTRGAGTAGVGRGLGAAGALRGPLARLEQLTNRLPALVAFPRFFCPSRASEIRGAGRRMETSGVRFHAGRHSENCSGGAVSVFLHRFR